jgi:hypothetical protein
MALRIIIFCLLGGLFFSLSSLGAGHFGWWLVAGVLISASLIPVVRYGPRHPIAQFGAMALALVVIGIWCTVSEGVLFYPEQKKQMLQALVGGTMLFGIAAAWLAVMARLLRLTDPAERIIERRPLVAAIPLVLVSGVAYLVYYEIFGAITFTLYTKRFYPHAAEQVMAMGFWFPLYQIGRGVLMTLAVLPLIYSLRMKRWQSALVVGIIVWIIGGGAPLLVPSAQMIPAQRYAHILEIMTQNVPLGMTAVWLLRRKAPVAASTRPTVAAV